MPTMLEGDGCTPQRATYFVGCDMGGWHTKKGDAVAACKWQNGAFHHLDAVSGSLYHPVPDEGPVKRIIQQASDEKARLIIAIDAALAWPVRFAELVRDAPEAMHAFVHEPVAAIDNPYLYRDTERYIKRYVLSGPKERPLTAPGDKFGNNSSKAQAYVAWLQRSIPDLYRPPFSPDIRWDPNVAKVRQHTVIEVYPAASSKSASFQRFRWPLHEQSMAELGSTDIADASRATRNTSGRSCRRKTATKSKT